MLILPLNLKPFMVIFQLIDSWKSIFSFLSRVCLILPSEKCSWPLVAQRRLFEQKCDSIVHAPSYPCTGQLLKHLTSVFSQIQSLRHLQIFVE